MSFQVRLDRFEGPLDLLLYLIQIHELDVSTVSISQITDQYLLMIRQIHELDFEGAGDFLVMAATLIQWKSRALLPQDPSEVQSKAGEEGEELTPEALVRQLLDHQRFRQAGQDLLEQPLLGEAVFARANRKPPTVRVWKHMAVTDLALAYQETLIRARRRSHILRKETVSLTDKMMEFGSRLEIGKPAPLSQFLPPILIRQETVVAFLAALELARLKKLRVHQQATYEMIYLELIESLASLDFSLAIGFEQEGAETHAQAPVG